MDEVFTDSSDIVEEVIEVTETSSIFSDDAGVDLVPSEASVSDDDISFSDSVFGDTADSSDLTPTPSPEPETSVLTETQTEDVSETGGGTDDVSEAETSQTDSGTDDISEVEVSQTDSGTDDVLETDTSEDSQTVTELLEEIQAQGEQLQAITLQLEETNERLADIQGNRLQGIMNSLPVIIFLLGAVIGVLLVSIWTSYLRP